MDRLDSLAQQRAHISLEIAQQRAGMALAAQRLHGPLRKIDRAREDLRFFRERYLYLLLPVALLVALNPGRTLRFLVAAAGAWRAFERARRGGM